ncbi:MAG TPA: Ig-like domain-containing protein, partial [Stellaceae bacterium]|nr:Ig-like domain-containing protein [Stellaceae bacterium]
EIGGANDEGTVFEIAKTGGGYASTPTTLVSFDGDNGAYPVPDLIADAAGNLFGMTGGGGNGDGTVFELSETGFQTPPIPTGLALAAASDGGAQGDDITDIATPTITGGGAAGDTVSVFDGPTLVGIATVAPDGSWSVTASPLADGTHSLAADQTDGTSTSALSSPLSLSIDTTPPAAPSGLVLDPSTANAGTAGGETDFTQVAIDGTGEAGDTVTLTEAGVSLGTATVASNGAWSVTTTALPFGPHQLIATETDSAGNISAASSAFPLDIVPPDLSLDFSTDSGIQGDDITDVADLEVTGEGQPGDTINLFDGSVLVGSITIPAGETWQLTTGALAPGPHSLTATETDTSGNTSPASAPLVVTIETVPPAPSALSLHPSTDSGVQGDAVTNAAQPEIDGQGQAGDTVALWDGATFVGTATVAGNGAWQLTTTSLAPGSYSLTASQTDNAGDTGAASAPLALTVTGTAETSIANGDFASGDFSGWTQSTFVTNPEQALDDANHTTAGFLANEAAGAPAPATNGVETTQTTDFLNDPSGTAITSPGPATNFAFLSNQISANEDLLTGSEISQSFTATGAALAFSVQFLSDEAVDSDWDYGGVALLSGSTVIDQFTLDHDPDSTTSAADVHATANPAGGFFDSTGWLNQSFSLNGLNGQTLTLVAYVENTGDRSVESRLLLTNVAETGSAPPPAPSDLALDPSSDSGVQGDGITNVAQPEIDGQGQAGDTVKLFDGAKLVGSATVGGNGAWAITSSPLSDGQHSLTATQTDTSGNTGGASSPLAVTIDTAPPAAPTGLALDPSTDSGALGDGITNVVQPEIDGTGEAGGTVVLSEAGTNLGAAIVRGDGTWSVTATALTLGPHQLTATETDTAGNTGAASPALALDIVPAAPVIDSVNWNNATQTVVISGHGFGSQSPYDGDSSFINIDKLPVGPGFSAGFDGGGFFDTVQLNVTSWTDTQIVINGFTGSYGGAFVFNPGDQATIYIANPAQSPAPSFPRGDAFQTSTTITIPGAIVIPPPTGLALDASTDSGALGDDVTNAATPLITGLGAAGDTVTLIDGATAVGTGTVAANGAWSIATAALADGEHSLTATETDTGGNVSGASTPLVVTIATTAPLAPSGLALDPSTDTGAVGDGVTASTQPLIDGRGEAGDTVTLLDGAAAVGTATVAVGGAWSVSTQALAPGNHSLTATETDAAGNTSAPSDPLALTVAPTSIGPSGPDQVFSVAADNQIILGTSGNDTIDASGSGNTIDGLAGDDDLSALGNGDAVDGGDGNDIELGVGAADTVSGGNAGDTLLVAGTGNTASGGNGDDAVWSYGGNATVSGGAGDDFLGVYGSGETVDGGGGNNVILLGAGDVLLLDGADIHHDTVIGFDPAAGDTIHLTTDTPGDAIARATQIDGGTDTRIALSDGSTIVLTGISHVDASFFA